MSSSPYVLLLHPWRPPPTEEVFVRVKVSAPEASVDVYNCRYVDTSFPYFGVKLSCVCLMIAYRKK